MVIRQVPTRKAFVALTALCATLGAASAVANEQPREKIAVFDVVSEGVDEKLAERIVGLVNERLVKAGGFAPIHEDVVRGALERGSNPSQCLRSEICLRDGAEFLEADLYITGALQKTGSVMDLELELALPQRSDLRFVAGLKVKRPSDLDSAVARCVDDLVKQYREPKRAAIRRPVGTAPPAVTSAERAPQPPQPARPQSPPPAPPVARPVEVPLPAPVAKSGPPILHRVHAQPLDVQGAPRKLSKSGTKYLERELAKRDDVLLVRSSKSKVEWVVIGSLKPAGHGYALTVTLSRADGSGTPLREVETMRKPTSLNMNIDLCLERLFASREWKDQKSPSR